MCRARAGRYGGGCWFAEKARGELGSRTAGHRNAVGIAGSARSLKPLATSIGDDPPDFRKLRRSHSTFCALNVHPRVARMSMGHGSFSTTMQYHTGVPADLQKRAAEALGELRFGAPNAPVGDPTPVTLPPGAGEPDALETDLKENSCGHRS